MYLYYLPKASSFWSVKEYFGVLDNLLLLFINTDVIVLKASMPLENISCSDIIFSFFWFVFPEIIQTWTNLKGERELIKFALMNTLICFVFLIMGVAAGDDLCPRCFPWWSRDQFELSLQYGKNRELCLQGTREKQTPPVLWGISLPYSLLSSWRRSFHFYVVIKSPQC